MNATKEQFLETLREKLSNLSEERDRVWIQEQHLKDVMMLPTGQVVERVRTTKLILDCTAEGALLSDGGEIDRELIQIHVLLEDDSEKQFDFVECLYFDEIPRLNLLLQQLGIQK